jgi:hypothetical protein
VVLETETMETDLAVVDLAAEMALDHVVVLVSAALTFVLSYDSFDE